LFTEQLGCGSISRCHQSTLDRFVHIVLASSHIDHHPADLSTVFDDFTLPVLSLTNKDPIASFFTRTNKLFFVPLVIPN
jgi:hypothetical protein